MLYGRRRVGKTTLLNEFCKGKDTIFYSAEQSNDKLNLEKFSARVFEFYGENTLEPFSSWENALLYIHDRQQEAPLVLVFDEFPYQARKNMALLSVLQHLIDHTLQQGNLFIILCGSYMGFMEKEVLGSKSPIFGRRTGQLHMKPLDYKESIRFLDTFSDEEKIKLYGAFGGTPLYLQQVEKGKSFEENIKQAFLRVTAYLYEEPLLLLRQEVQEPGVYNAIIEAIAAGASKAAEIATKTGEEQAKCLKYIKTLCSLGELPVLFTSIGRWWGTDPASRQQVEIDLIASDGNDYLVCECKWRNTLLEISVLNKLRQRADVFNKNRHETWYYLFSKTSFTSALLEEAKKDGHVVLVDLEQILR